MKELSAADITRKALEILNTRNIEAWRQTISTKKNRKNVITPGIPDILGFNRSTGQLVVCEVKKNGDTLKPAQKEFLSKVRKAGAVALIARQIGTEVQLIEY